MTTFDDPRPTDDLKALDRLVGTWTVTGGAEGSVRYEWMPGGFFLLQHVDLLQEGRKVTGMEVIGNPRPFGEPTGPDVVSRFYDSLGNTLDYVYELTGDLLTIWGGVKGARPTSRGPSTPPVPHSPGPGPTPGAAATPPP